MTPFTDYLPLYGTGAMAERPWWRVVTNIDGFSYVERSDGMLVHCGADLGKHDTNYPIPAPRPMCGQVWARMTEGEVERDSIIYACAGRVILASDTALLACARIREWDAVALPSFGWVLVHGPFAPWAPVWWKP